MIQPIFLLSPPRSYSSVISSILGQHPQLHSFPELQIWAHYSVSELLAHEGRSTRRRLVPPGLLREIAFQMEGVQNEDSIARAWAWLVMNKNLSIDSLFTQLCSYHAPKACIEKSPVNSSSLGLLLRILRSYPHAKFLHLARSAVSSTKSIEEFLAMKYSTKKSSYLRNNPVLVWYGMHSTIRRFSRYLHTGNYLLVRGEDILSEPESTLAIVAKWLGISSSASCISSMLRPEDSPFAFFGPPMAAGGNDPKFMSSPKFRLRKRSVFRSSLTRDYLRAEFSDKNLSLPSSLQTNSDFTISSYGSLDYRIIESIVCLEASLGYADGYI